ncbi:MAG TPA: hypothetical protein VMB19_01215 [Silvibacterium sp.]|nr:hypothetical protein [Silvibacterium sp.]
MATDFLERCEVIEECYEFLLAYAAQGLPADDGGRVHEFLQRAASALSGLPESCSRAVRDQELGPADKYAAFGSMLQRDATDSITAIELVLAQPVLSSQLIDNLNASSHLRALLTDIFLIGEVLRTRDKLVPVIKDAGLP